MSKDLNSGITEEDIKKKAKNEKRTLKPRKMTQLDAQLAVVKRNVHSSGSDKNKDTLLLGSTKDAAKIDYQSVLKIAIEGLKELIAMDARFKPFERSLFNESTVTSNRMTMSKEERESLDENIKQYLGLLSSYFLLLPAQKTLEWLIRRYRINEFNIDHLIMSIIPYHQSNAFAHILSIIRYESDVKWRFLIVFKHNKVTVTREYISSLVHSHTFFAELLCNTVMDYYNDRVLSKTMISFFTALMVDATSTGTMTEEFHRTLLPCLNFSLKSRNLDLQLGSFMILGNLASKVQFSDEVNTLIIQNTLKNCRDSITASFTFLLVLIQRQNFTSIHKDNLELLVSTPYIGEILIELHNQNKSLIRLIALVLVHLCENFVSNIDCFELLKVFINDLPTTPTQHRVITSSIFKLVMRFSDKEAEEKYDRLGEIIRLMDPRLVQQVCEENKDFSTSDRVSKFREVAFSQKVTSSSVSNTVFLKLQSPNTEQRIEGLALLKEQIELCSDDVYTFGNVLADRLSDNEITVALAAWELPNVLDIVGLSGVVKSLQELLEMTKKNIQHIEKVKEIVKAAVTLFDENEEKANQLAYVLMSRGISKKEDNGKVVNFCSFLLETMSTLKNTSPFFKFVKCTNNKSIISNLQTNLSKSDIQIQRDLLFKSNIFTIEKLFIILAMIKLKKENTQDIIIEFVDKYITSCNFNKQQSTVVVDFESLILVNEEFTSDAMLYIINEVATSQTPIESSEAFLTELQSLAAMGSKKTINTTVTTLYTLFNHLFGILSSINPTSPVTSRVETIIQAIIKKYLSNHLVLLKFLSLIWSNDVYNIKVQESALNLSQWFLKSKQFANFATNQEIFALYLVPLLSSEKNIRDISIACIKLIESSVSKSTAASTKTIGGLFKGSLNPLTKAQYVDLLSTIDDYSRELSTDSSFFATFVVNILLLEEEKEKADREALVSFFGEITNLYESRKIQSKVLSTLTKVTDPILLNKLKEYLNTLLNEFQNQNSGFDLNTAALLNVLLQHLTRVESLANRKNSHLVTLYRVLELNHSIEIEGQDGEKQSFRVLDTVLPLITPQLVNALPLKDQSKIIISVLDLLHSCPDLEARQMASNTLHKVLVDSKCILSVLEDASAVTTVPRITAIMETIKENSPSIKNLVSLFRPVFTILKSISNRKEDDEENVGLEYCKQTTISCILTIAQSFSPKDSELFEHLFDVQVVLDCVSHSSNEQTRNYALLLLGNVACQAPNLVFNKFSLVLSMVKSTLSNNDDSTFRVLTQFLSQVLPSIVGSDLSIASIMQLFIDSFFDIADQYRTALFVAMFKSIDFVKLDLFSALILVKKIQLLRKVTELEATTKGANKKKPTKNGASTEDKMQVDQDVELPQDSKVVRDLNSFNQFIVDFTDLVPALQLSVSLSQLTSMVNLISIDSAKIEEADDESSIVDKESITLLKKITSKDVRLLQANILEFVEERLTSTSYLENLSFKVEKPQKEEIEEQYLQSFSNLLVLLRNTTEYMEKLNKQSDGSSTAVGKEKFLKKLLNSCHKCMDKYNQLLSVDGFVQTVGKLLGHADSQVRRRSLVIFNDKITAVKRQLSEEQVMKFLSLLDDFLKIVKSEGETDTNKQTALLSFEILARNFARTYPGSFTKQMPTIIHAMGDDNHQVVSSSLICIATLCSELQANVVQYIPQFFPVLLSTLTGSYSPKSTVDPETRALLQLSCVSSVEMMLKKIAKFLSPYLPQLLNALLHPCLTMGAANKLYAQVKRVLSLITKNIELRLLLPAMTSAYEFAVASENDQSIICLFDFVGEISSNLTPKDVALHHRSIFKFYLQGFEFRKRYQLKVKNIDAIEEHIISSFLVLVLKLNENLFKPIFIKIVDWALHLTSENNNTNNDKKQKTTNGKQHTESTQNKQPLDIDNTIFFYKLINSLANNLKAIFVPYTGYFLEDSIQHLEEIIIETPSTSSNNEMTNGKRKKSHTNSDIGGGKNVDPAQDLLLKQVISALQKCMLHDRDGFLDKQRFEKLMPVLVNQLENQMGGAAGGLINHNCAYSTRVNDYLVPCLAQLAVTINQDLLWKPLNHAILMRTRSAYPNVRFAALQAVESLHKRLGEQLLVLLPETIPFISELLEDSVPEIEQLTQSVVKTIESHLGVEESISSYL